ncbi:gp436 family protein [Sapientia aquatica]|uniref:DUF1320 domain-containing protein n=1 Tax=Sapientia aquatica TaxID=1549640 RepID=A0A4R5W1C4_9BURK|nr:DUF1320 domain-containing protein [Sapientia aquatica]TDK65981.1 DUF1320 domain-containing protein [Sapientia aquatica]
MRYLTIDDIRLAIPTATLIALSSDDPLAQDIDIAVIERAAASTEELIDAHLRGRYVLPLTNVPTVIRDSTVVLVRHQLYSRRPEGADLPKAISDSYQATLKVLADIRDGRLTIGLDSGQAQPEPGVFKVRAAKKSNFGDRP